MKAENGHSSPAAAPETDSGIVITSRVRLARNVKDFPFPGWMKKADRLKLLSTLDTRFPYIRAVDPPSPVRVEIDISQPDPRDASFQVLP